MQKENVYIDGITSTLQAGGGFLAGGGMLWAAAVFGLWKAPAIGAWITSKAGDALSDLVDPGGILDDIADAFLDGSPITLRREAQSLAARRATLVTEEASYCTIAASTYDAALCDATFDRKTQYYADLLLFHQKVRDHNALHGDSWDFIVEGLGDIDPDKDSNPTTTRSGISSVTPSSSIGKPVSYAHLGSKGYTNKSASETLAAFNRTFAHQYYSIQPGAHFYNQARLTDAIGTYVAFDVEWDGSQWLYALDGSFDAWRVLHLQQMTDEAQERMTDAEAAEAAAKAEAEAAGENYSERPGYYDEESGTWMFDN